MGILDANYEIKRENPKEKVKFIQHQSIPEDPARRTNPDLILIKDLAKGNDPYNWLDYATHYLATLNISDHDRLNVLRRHISSKLRIWDRQLEKKWVNRKLYLVSGTIKKETANERDDLL